MCVEIGEGSEIEEKYFGPYHWSNKMKHTVPYSGNTHQTRIDYVLSQNDQPFQFCGETKKLALNFSWKVESFSTLLILVGQAVLKSFWSNNSPTCILYVESKNSWTAWRPKFLCNFFSFALFEKSVDNYEVVHKSYWISVLGAAPL